MKTGKKIFALSVVVFVVFSLCACTNGDAYTKMPLGGNVTFHEIFLTIPENFVRDSTASSEDLWIFEKGFYKEYLIIKRSDNNADATETFGNYNNFIIEQGGNSTLGKFIGKEAVLCSYTKEDFYCQELMFEYKDSIYNITLRDGDSDTFGAIMDSVKLLGNEEETETVTDCSE